jgi:signal transduction histidine kinase
MRKHPTFGDSLLALSLLVMELPALLGDSLIVAPWLLYFVTDILLIAPIVLRRRNSALACYLILVAGLFQLVTQGPMNVARGCDIALGITLYTMVVYVGRRQAAVYALWLLAGTVIWATWRITPQNNMWLALFVVLMVFAFCWVLGEFVGARRAYLNEMEQRLRLLETERDHQAKIAVAEERARIARELHDVVAHAVSVMVVQADGASYAVHTNPELAERAVKTISATGREALTELRRLLGVLRSEDSADETRTPQPGTTSLNDLAERVRLVGLPVRLKLKGELDGLPAGIGLGVYRIVQEALTNTLKHAGAGASALVQVTRVGENVELDITDDGFGTPHQLVGISGGNGLIGMRERANVFGGTLDAGPRPGGGWHVHAVLPIQGS